MAIGSFKDLDAWRVGMDLMLRMYEVIKQLPSHERFEMASQMRRAAASIPFNVAEGHACRIRKRYRYHGIWKQLLAETTAVLSLIVILWLSL